MRFKHLVFAAIMALGLTVTSDLQAVQCLLATGHVCDGVCVDLDFEGGTNCSPSTLTYKIERRVCGQSNWTTLSTNATSPYHDCPPVGFCYEYRITLSCGSTSSPCATTSQIETVTCAQ